MKKIELVRTYGEDDPEGEYLRCRVAGVGKGFFRVLRIGASDEAWEAVKERLFGDPSADLPEGVAVAADGRMYAPGDVVQTLPDAEWERRPWMAGSWYDSPNVKANDEWVYELRRRPTPRTERVPWHEAQGHAVDCPRRKIEEVGRDEHGPFLILEGSGRTRVPIAADGTVEVLTEDGPR